ncbi:heavy-metal-associated domain-containing protein [Aquabacterium sp.]|uniref:heavy-metal-associated domain-containing protein n=1 Tax=Aquabacterium sp. TaxID=1872578 RepID=UPI0035B03077
MSTANTFQLTVEGMSCQHCVKAVTQAIQTQDADAAVAVDLPGKQVTVTSTLSREAVAAAIADEGYNVTA